MYRLTITGGRSFIVAKADVFKGGINRVYAAGEKSIEEVELAPGKFVYEVSDKCGAFLETYNDVFVVDKPAEKKKKKK